MVRTPLPTLRNHAWPRGCSRRNANSARPTLGRPSLCFGNGAGMELATGTRSWLRHLQTGRPRAPCPLRGSQRREGLDEAERLATAAAPGPGLTAGICLQPHFLPELQADHPPDAATRRPRGTSDSPGSDATPPADGRLPPALAERVSAHRPLPGHPDGRPRNYCLLTFLERT